MKKKTKKLLSLVFAVVMTACTVVLAFAAEPKEEASPNMLTTLTFNSGTEYTLGEGMKLSAYRRSAYVTEMTFYKGLTRIDFSNYIKWTADGPLWHGSDCAVRLDCYATYKRNDHYADSRLEKITDKYFVFPNVGIESVPYNIVSDSLDMTWVDYSGSPFAGWDQFYTWAFFYLGYKDGDELTNDGWTDFSMLNVGYSQVKQLDT